MQEEGEEEVLRAEEEEVQASSPLLGVCLTGVYTGPAPASVATPSIGEQAYTTTVDAPTIHLSVCPPCAL